jgi:hypothetical protein
MESVREFLEYNKENIIANLIEIEDHLRNLPKYYDPLKGEASCVIKHALMVYGEAGEGISHAAEIKPEEVEVFRKIRAEIKELIEDVKRREDPEKLIVKVRKIRKLASSVYLPAMEEKCRACRTNFKDILYRLKSINKSIMVSEAFDRAFEGGAMALGTSPEELSSRVVPEVIGRVGEIIIDLITTPIGGVILRGVAGGLCYLAASKLEGRVKSDLIQIGTHLLVTMIPTTRENFEVIKSQAEKFGSKLGAGDVKGALSSLFKVGPVLGPAPVVEIAPVRVAPVVEVSTAPAYQRLVIA